MIESFFPKTCYWYWQIQHC